MVNVGVVLSHQPILKVGNTTERNVDHELMSSSLILLYNYVHHYNIDFIILIKSIIINIVD